MCRLVAQLSSGNILNNFAMAAANITNIFRIRACTCVTVHYIFCRLLCSCLSLKDSYVVYLLTLVFHTQGLLVSTIFCFFNGEVSHELDSANYCCQSHIWRLYFEFVTRFSSYLHFGHTDMNWYCCYIPPNQSDNANTFASCSAAKNTF